MNDLEQLMFSYYVIYFEKFIKIMERTEKEARSCHANILVMTNCRPGVIYKCSNNLLNSLGIIKQLT